MKKRKLLFLLVLVLCFSVILTACTPEEPEEDRKRDSRGRRGGHLEDDRHPVWKGCGKRGNKAHEDEGYPQEKDNRPG